MIDITSAINAIPTYIKKLSDSLPKTVMIIGSEERGKIETIANTLRHQFSIVGWNKDDIRNTTFILSNTTSDFNLMVIELFNSFSVPKENIVVFSEDEKYSIDFCINYYKGQSNIYSDTYYKMTVFCWDDDIMIFQYNDSCNYTFMPY